ncbi:MAG: DUF512 domain-containing protein [Cyanobacteria bacterium P01_H01_bin.74]
MLMTATIAKILPNSPADFAGLLTGDTVLSVNDNNTMEDMFDYQLEIADCELLDFQVLRNGQEFQITLEKDLDEDVGIVFTSPIFTPIKTCNNGCDFCFIDQQPGGLRPSLYVKDDDYRLSYFTNTYITLTNLNSHDRKRIEQLRPGPLYVSVHSTVPTVRVKALRNFKGGNIMENLNWLRGLGVPFHCQIVICPGLTDGDSLTQSLNDLYTLRPEALSVAVVPVGLTQYREHLNDLIPVDSSHAAAVIKRITAFKQQKLDANDFVFLSDEFYFKAGLPLPSYNDYGDFPQLEDGVGTGRMLLETFFDQEADLPKSMSQKTTVLLLTGKLGAMILQPIVTRLNAIDNLFVDLVAVQSSFWGQSVDVAGLITGADIVNTVLGMHLVNYRSAIIPGVMLKDGTDLFLDDKSVAEVSAQIELPIQIVHDAYSADALLSVLFNENQNMLQSV